MTLHKVGGVMAAEVVPVPTVVEGRWVLLVLVDAHRRMPWLADVSGPTAIEELKLELGRIEADLPPGVLDMRLHPLTGDYGLAGGITCAPEWMSPVLAAQQMPRGLQTMRGLLWATCRYCHRAGLPYLSGSSAIASALRSAQSSLHSSAARALMPVLEDLGNAESVTDAINTLSALANATNKSLAQASARWLVPRLAEITTAAAVGASPQPEPGRYVAAASRTSVGSRSNSADRSDTIKGRWLVHPRQPSTATVDIEGIGVNEPCDEHAEAVLLVTVPGHRTGADR